MRRKISALVDGGLSGGSRVRRPWSEDPHRRERKFSILVGGVGVTLLAFTPEGIVVGF